MMFLAELKNFVFHWKNSHFIAIFYEKCADFIWKIVMFHNELTKSVEVLQSYFGAKTIILMWKENLLFSFEKITNLSQFFKGICDVFWLETRDVFYMMTLEQMMLLSWCFEGTAIVFTKEDLLLLFGVNNLLSQIYDIV